MLIINVGKDQCILCPASSQVCTNTKVLYDIIKIVKV